MKYLLAFFAAFAVSPSIIGVDAATVQKRGPKTAGSCVIPYVIWDPSHQKFGPKGPDKYDFGGEQFINGETWHICNFLKTSCGASQAESAACAKAKADSDGKQQQGMQIFNQELGIGPYDGGNPGTTTDATIAWKGSDQNSEVVPTTTGGDSNNTTMTSGVSDSGDEGNVTHGASNSTIEMSGAGHSDKSSASASDM